MTSEQGQLIRPGEADMYKKIYDTLEKQGMAKTAVILDGSGAGRKCLVSEEQCKGLSEDFDWTPYEKKILETEETGIKDINGSRVFVEIYRKNPHLVILGGGHVACPVAKIGKLLGFHITVMDDREEFISQERFPEADERILGSFDELAEKIPPYKNAYYVVITRGHMGDAACARQLLKRPYAYLGMIGSRTKVRLTREKLEGEGFTKEKLDTIHAPIGLPIGGQLPEEIAVSIMAEIVQEKNRCYTAFCDEKVEKEVTEGKHGVMVTIIRKTGSSPRGTGSKMFVQADGSLVGSIGGGSVEFEAVKHCSEAEDMEVISYRLNTAEKENLGMICGGNVEVLFERV